MNQCLSTDRCRQLAREMRTQELIIDKPTLLHDDSLAVCEAAVPPARNRPTPPAENWRQLNRQIKPRDVIYSSKLNVRNRHQVLGWSQPKKRTRITEANKG